MQVGVEIEMHKWIAFPALMLQKTSSNSMATEIKIEMLLKL